MIDVSEAYDLFEEELSFEDIPLDQKEVYLNRYVFIDDFYKTEDINGIRYIAKLNNMPNKQDLSIGTLDAGKIIISEYDNTIADITGHYLAHCLLSELDLIKQDIQNDSIPFHNFREIYDSVIKNPLYFPLLVDDTVEDYFYDFFRYNKFRVCASCIDFDIEVCTFKDDNIYFDDNKVEEDYLNESCEFYR